MATAIGRRGPNDRRPSVLATSETGRIRGEASLPAHRAGGRIPVGGAGLRARLAYVSAATTAIAALAFLVPLGWELREDHRDQAMSTAEQRSALVAGAIAAGANKKNVDAAVKSAGGGLVVHPPDTVGTTRAGADDVLDAAKGTEALVIEAENGLVRLEPVRAGDKTSVVEAFVSDEELGAGTARDWW